MKKKILFICGSLNQTTMMHQISKFFKNQYDCYFSPYYSDGIINNAAQKGLLDFCVLGGKFRQQTEDYLSYHELNIDYRGVKNIRDKKVIHVQEGMTDPLNLFYYLAKYLKFPRWLASTSATGISGAFDVFCVASEGYKELFTKKGADPNKLVVTGIPNFDNAKKYFENDFPHKNYVMVATSDTRETFKYENRKKFIFYAKKLAKGKRLLFKLHPNEKFDRAKKEIDKYAPGSLVYQQGNTNHMIANCNMLITKYSSVVYIGMALGKKVNSYFNLEDLKKLMPIQNNGTSAERIAGIGLQMVESPKNITEEIIGEFNYKQVLNH